MSDFSINVKLNGVDTAVSTIGQLEAALKATRLIVLLLNNYQNKLEFYKESLRTHIKKLQTLNRT